MKREFLPGVIADLPIDDYHAMTDCMSKSGLDTIDQAPFIYYARTLDPNRPPETQKAGQLEGQLAHCSILEPDEFEKRYVVGPTLNRNTNAWKKFVEDNDDRVAIQSDQYDAAMRQADSVRSLPEIREALSAGAPEQSAFWIDPDTGAQCRCRPDWTHECNESSVILLDVKTYSDASPGEFRRQIARKRYHVQDAFYSDGFAAASGLDVLAFVFVAVETAYPYAASAVMIDGASRDQGRAVYKRDLKTYMQCLESGEWPGYSKEISLVTLPNWAFQE
jgi:exodeoxyribonuclease VIII